METTPKKILIVDDSKVFTLVLKKGLIRNGFSVITARDGTDGLVAAKNEKPDLILLDVVMADMDGITMAEKLKESDTQPQIIFLTNIMDAEHIRAALKANIEMDCIVKSELSIDSIVERIKDKLNMR